MAREGGTLTVLKFHTPEGARQVLTEVETLQKRELIRLHDAAIVQWAPDKKKPKTEQLNNLTGAGALNGTFWGMLFGLLFFVPFLGAAIGAGMGALTGSMVDIGIDDDFIKSVRDQVTPGTSALFLMTSGAVLDRVHEALSQYEFDLIATNLSSDEEQRLREAFEDEEQPLGA